MISALKAYAFQGISVVLLVLLGYQTWRLHNAQLDLADFKVTLSNERSKASAAVAKAEREVRAKEQSLQESAAQTRKEMTDAVSTVTAQRDALLKRLRIAEAKLSTAGGMPQATAASTDGTASSGDVGAELPAAIGEEDVQEAHRADVVRLALIGCYKDYEKARQALSK